MSETYKSKTAGSLMVLNVPVISEDAVVSDVENLLLKETKNFASIDYVYALNGHGHLKGVISLKEVFRSPKDTPINNLFTKDIISVRTHTHQERAARLALSHGLKAIPVIDKGEKFLGVLTNDAILKILASEGIEDILKIGGISRASVDDVLSLSLSTSLKHRLPWLLLGLLGGIMTAKIVGLFDDVLSDNVALAAFIPMLAYMANAVGAQMQVFIIRDFALNPKFKFVKYFFKQAFLAFLIAVIVSVILYVLYLAFGGDAKLSFVLGTALFISIMTSLLTGLIIPYMFGKLKMDPANASGPIATIIQDALSIFVYFYIASLIL